ncbi:hypothetical protein Q3G72_009596 [Acer saccharum]|nr:hypothetical protein Q3G72_009596 [Acer saccharum]
MCEMYTGEYLQMVWSFLNSAFELLFRVWATSRDLKHFLPRIPTLHCTITVAIYQPGSKFELGQFGYFRTINRRSTGLNFSASKILRSILISCLYSVVAVVPCLKKNIVSD